MQLLSFRSVRDLKNHRSPAGNCTKTPPDARRLRGAVRPGFHATSADRSSRGASERNSTQTFVEGYGRVDNQLFLFDSSRDDGRVSLLDEAALEVLREPAERFARLRDHEQPRRVPVETVYEAGTNQLRISDFGFRI